MILYNQRDTRWASKIYSAKAPHTETIKSSGCGVTSAAMIVSNLTGEVVTPDVMADYSVANGFRMDGVGTAFGLFPDIAKKYNLNCMQANDIQQAINCISDGGMVVCSTDGGPTGLFSTGGHIFIMSGANGDSLEFVDPDLYAGKYDTSYRKYKARVTAGRVYVQKDIAKLYITTYFCFTKGEEEMAELIYNWTMEVPEWGRPTIQKLLDKGYLKGDEAGALGVNETMLKILVINDRAGLYDLK